MKWNPRGTLLAAAVLALAAGNLWYWWPRSAESPRMADRAAARGAFRAEDFRLPMAAPESARARRDLFQPRVVAALKPAKKPEAPPPPLSKTPEQIEEEAARADLAQIKLMGVVSRGGTWQAYLVKGTDVFMVRTGEKVAGRFTVETIAADAVQLKDPKTNVTGRIPVSGN